VQAFGFRLLAVTKGLERIADRVIEVDFTSNHVIARQGDDGTGFFIIAS
jgi:hypothetical protein